MINRRLRHIAWVSGVIVLVIGVMGTLCWVLDTAVQGSVLPGFAPMKMNAAVAFVLAGTSLLLQMTPGAPQHRTHLGRGCAVIVLAIGCATLFEYLTDVDLHIDELLVRAPDPALHASRSARMAVLTAIGFALSGAALMLLDAGTRPMRLTSQVLAFGVLLVGLVVCTGYLLGATALYALPGLTSMAVHTAIGFTVFATGVLLSRPSRAIIEVLAQDNPAGAAIRRILVQSVVMLLIVGWLRAAGQRAGYYGAELGATLAMSGSTVGITAIALWNTAIQRSADQSRQHVRLDERLLLELGDLLRSSARSGEALSQVSTKLGEYMDVSRCLFLQIEAADGRVTIRDDYHAGVPSLEGTQALSSWSPDSAALLRAGTTIVNSDASVDERTAARYEAALLPLQIRSYVAVPLARDDRWVSTLFASTHVARRWQPREVVLIQSVAERTWWWFEHLLALEVLREREQHLAAVLDAAFDAIISTDDRGVILEFSRAAEQTLGHQRGDMIGKLLVETLVPSAQRAVHRTTFTQLLATADSSVLGKPTQLPVVRADGCELTTEICVMRMQDREPPRFTAFMRNITERKRAMDQVLLAIEAAPTGMILVDRDGNIALVNAQLETLFGYPRDLLVSQPVELLVPEPFRREHPGLRKALLGDPRFHTMGAGRELFGLHRDGRWIPISIALHPFHNENGEFVLASVVDITERKRAEQNREDLLGQLGALNAELEHRVRDRTSQLTAALKEREVLLQEVHHRVKNNLQIISSLIKLQIRKIEDVDDRTGLEECRRRVVTIALIHEQLYQAKDYSEVPFSDYVKRLVSHVFHATSGTQAMVTLDVQVDDISLPVDKAIPCGLILNELITNALKHAFPAGRRGSIRITLQHASASDVTLAVSDDGVGAPHEMAQTGSLSLGMRLIEMLVKQIHGRLEISRTDGMTFRVTFPLIPALRPS